jgi:hypothetical protein
VSRSPRARGSTAGMPDLASAIWAFPARAGMKSDLNSARKFRIGQSVSYRPATHRRNAPHGTYQITRFLPQRKDGELEYHIRNLNEGHEQVARESELRSA